MKANYKIRVKSTGKFISGNGGSKSTWQREYAAIDRIKELTTTKKMSQYKPEYQIDDLELLVFPISDAIVIDAKVAVEDYEMKSQNLKESAESKQLRKDKMELLAKMEALTLKLNSIEEKLKSK